MPIESTGAHESFTTFGSFLQFLRLRVGKNLRDMALAVGYSEAHLSRIERGERRPPHRALLLARFVPALELEQEPGLSARLLELAEHDRQLLSLARLPAPIYATILASYRPIEARSKRWAVTCPDQTTRRLRVQAYCDFVASASHSWPVWPPNPHPPSFLLQEQELSNFEAVALTTMLWAVWVEAEMGWGLRVLTLLYEDLQTALGGAGGAGGRLREPLWRPEPWLI